MSARTDRRTDLKLAAIARCERLSDNALQMILDHYCATVHADRNAEYKINSQAALLVARRRGI